LLRHGEVKGGTCFRGQTDDPLTAKGWEQMQQAVFGYQWDVVISSPLCRCLDFSHWLSIQRKLPIKVVHGFSEIDFGDWEGKTAEQIEQQQPGVLSEFYEKPDQRSPGNGERISVFSQRVYESWRQVIIENAGKKLLVVTHSGVIRMIFTHILDISVQKSFSIQIDHACVSRFQHFRTGEYEYCQFLKHQNM
jgi:broad specificity phosphatase PhoE